MPVEAPTAPPPKATPASPPPASPPKPAAPSAPDDTPVPDDLMAELEALDPDVKRPAPTTTPPAKPEKPEKPKIEAPEGVKTNGEPPKPAEKPTDKPVEKPYKVDDPEPVRIVELRNAYRAQKKLIREELEPKVAKLETELKEAREKQPDVSPLKEQLAAVQKRNAELEQEMEFTNFTRSEKYKSQYEVPYLNAWNDALADLKELTVELADGTSRQATQDDMLALANMPLGEARKRATEMFGDAADDVMAHRRKIMDLAKAQNAALADARKNGEERRKTAGLEAKAHSERMQKLWGESNKELSEKYPKWFSKSDGDTEGNTLLEKGFAMADRLFAPTEETRPKTPEEAVKLHALIRNKVANHDRLALRLKQANARIAELQTALDEYEKHEPSGGTGGTPAKVSTKNWEEEAADEIDALNKP